MKTQKLIGAVMMVSLGFTACQKDDVLAPRPAFDQSIARQKFPATIPQQIPDFVKDLRTGIVKRFLYDDFKHLVMIKEDDKNSAFSYDRAGRVARIITTDLMGRKNSSSILVMNYDGMNQKPASISEYEEGVTKEGNLIKTIAIKYDSRMNKVSEIEIDRSRDIAEERTMDAAQKREFVYDAAGNCIQVSEFRGNELLKIKKFADFDLHPSFNANLGVLALLPGEVFQKSNATTVVETNFASALNTRNIGMTLTLHYKFAYDKLGFPINVVEIQSDFEETVQEIIYLNPRWEK